MHSGAAQAALSAEITHVHTRTMARGGRDLPQLAGPPGRGWLGGWAAGGTSKGGAEVKPTRMDVGELSTGVWYMNMCICEAM